MRIGFGYDIHTFEAGKDLIIGGVKIPYSMGLMGHSDADVLIHSIVDALLGASGSGDIGEHFPDTSDEFKNIKSETLLIHTKNILDVKNYKILNIDSTLILEKPKMKEYREKIVENIVRILQIDNKSFNIKFKTNERCDSTGKGEAIDANAVCLIRLNT